MPAFPDRIACLKRLAQTDAVAGAGIPTKTYWFDLDKNTHTFCSYRPW